MTLIFLLLILFVPALAQGDSTISLNSNRTAVLRLNGDGAFAASIYSSPGGETVTVTADSGGALDVVLELIDADGSTIAYADAPENDTPSIMRVVLDEPGEYSVRVNTFNGEGSGDIDVMLAVEPSPVLTPDEPRLWLPLGANEVATVQLAGFDATTALTITVRDPKGLLDPHIELVDAEGALLAANDDHETPDVSLNRFDARLTTTIPDNTTLRITDFLGRPGWFEVAIRP